MPRTQFNNNWIYKFISLILEIAETRNSLKLIRSSYFKTQIPE